MPARAADDLRSRLTELRDVLTEQLRTAPAAYTAGLARQLQSTLLALAELPQDSPDDIVAVLQRRRAERLAAAGVPEPPSRSR